MSVRTVSYGGGVQSTALLVLAARNEIPHRLMVFANVGDRAENPETIAYFRDHARPFAAEHGIKLVQRRWVDRHGNERDLFDDLWRQKRSLTIPLRDTGGFSPRKCTERYKIQVVARYLRDHHNATVEDPAEVALGISTDEIQRAKPGVDRGFPWTYKTYPLLDLGISRPECLRIVADAGLPKPPKSSCWFCPFQSVEQWRQRRRNNPDLWEQAVELDAEMRERHVNLRGDVAGLAHATLTIDEAVDDQLALFGDDCDSGWCFT